MDLPPLADEWQLPTRYLGRRVWLFERVGSTNTLALALAEDSRQDGLVVLAREQTAGRGQYGRAWLAPAGSSVLMSVVWFPPPPLRRPALQTAWAAVSVCRLLQHVVGRRAHIKWPNDVLVSGRKICGILLEQRASGAGLASVAGIGLNVSQSREMLAAAGLPEATSLAILTGQILDWRTIARQLIAILDEAYAGLHEGDLGSLEEDWKRRLGLFGKPVRAELFDHTSVHGRLREISFDRLDLEFSSGEVRSFPPEQIKHLQGRSSEGQTPL